MSVVKRRRFIKDAVLTSAIMISSPSLFSQTKSVKKMPVKFRLLRHAALLIEIAGKTLLVDPMLSKKEAMDPVKNAGNTLRIPMVDLPVTDEELIQIINKVDAVLVTHTHRDHWDVAAQQLIPKDKPVLCQPADESVIKAQGFTNVSPVNEMLEWNKIKIHRTGGQHGTGEIGKLMGTVSGYVLEYGNDKLYIAGDTIWCKEVEEAVQSHQPGHIIINGGGARFLTGGPITMTTEDMITLLQFTKSAITVVHLDTVNHCLEKRADFKAAAEKNQLNNRINIPNDGEWITVV